MVGDDLKAEAAPDPGCRVTPGDIKWLVFVDPDVPDRPRLQCGVVADNSITLAFKATRDQHSRGAARHY